VRYADDFVVLCGTRAEAQQALEAVQRWTAEAGRTLHPVKRRIVDATQVGGSIFSVTTSSAAINGRAARGNGNFETRFGPRRGAPAGTACRRSSSI
jgi:hypothetical protein